MRNRFGFQLFTTVNNVRNGSISGVSPDGAGCLVLCEKTPKQRAAIWGRAWSGGVGIGAPGIVDDGRRGAGVCPAPEITVPPLPDQTSRFATFRAFSWMNSRRGSTMSPIRVEKTVSASSPWATLTCSRVRASGSSVVSQS